MSVFTKYNQFQRVKGRVYQRHPTKPLIWRIGHQKSEWMLHFWPQDTADVTIPWYAEPLVWLGLVNPHDPDLIAAAFVHDKLLRTGHDARFAAAEFRRAYAARIGRAIKQGRKPPSSRWLITPYYWAVYFHTVRNSGQTV